LAKKAFEQQAIRASKRAKEKTPKFIMADGTNNLFNRHNLAIAVYHVPSDMEVSFKAMITGFSENYASSWNEEEVYGRTDPIVTYNNTKRTISLSWQVAGSTIDECRQNLGRIGLLINMLYPTYELRGNVLEEGPFPFGTISSAPLVKLKFANMISDSSYGALSFFSAKRDGLLGKIGSLSVEPDDDTGYIQVARGGLIPKIVNLSIDFLVIHEKPVGWAQGPDKKVNTFDSGKIRGFDEYGEYPYGASHHPRGEVPFDSDEIVYSVETTDMDGGEEQANSIADILKKGQALVEKYKQRRKKKSGPENSQKANIKRVMKS
jgi:hypothetical protein